MIKALYILSFVALALAGWVLLSCAAGARETDAPVEVLATSSAVESFKQSSPHADHAGDRVPPLVQQARLLALYLDPPRPQRPTPAVPQEDRKTRKVAAKPASSTPKFELHGISYYPAEPARSMAMVFEPGSGRRWVRQGTQLGHLVIEQINSTSVVYRDGQKRREMALASGAALAQYAKNLPQTRSLPASRPPGRQPTGPPPPPPIRAIRRMPATRVASKIGLSMVDIEVPDSGRTESK